MLLVSGPFVYYRKRRTNLMQGAARIPTSDPRFQYGGHGVITDRILVLIWSIFLVILPLVIVLLYFTHVILEEAKCFFSSHRSRGTTVVSLIDLVYLGQISCVYIFKFMVLLPPKSCSNRGTTLFMLIIYATNAIIFLKAAMFELST